MLILHKFVCRLFYCQSTFGERKISSLFYQRKFSNFSNFKILPKKWDRSCLYSDVELTFIQDQNPAILPVNNKRYYYAKWVSKFKHLTTTWVLAYQLNTFIYTYKRSHSIDLWVCWKQKINKQYLLNYLLSFPFNSHCQLNLSIQTRTASRDLLLKHTPRHAGS